MFTLFSPKDKAIFMQEKLIELHNCTELLEILGRFITLMSKDNSTENCQKFLDAREKAEILLTRQPKSGAYITKTSEFTQRTKKLWMTGNTELKQVKDLHGLCKEAKNILEISLSDLQDDCQDGSATVDYFPSLTK